MKRILALFFCLVALSLHTAAAPKPNLIVILVDDMGFSDLGCDGGEIPTPSIPHSLLDQRWRSGTST